jgi:hypothetical protein
MDLDEISAFEFDLETQTLGRLAALCAGGVDGLRPIKNARKWWRAERGDGI